MEQNKYLEYWRNYIRLLRKRPQRSLTSSRSSTSTERIRSIYLSDIHGEYEAFSHVLKNGSGAVRKKIDDVFGHTLGTAEKRSVATLIYYPREKLETASSVRGGYAELVSGDALPSHRALQGSVVQVHEIQGQKGIAAGLCLCDRRAHHGKAGAL